ncbi:hypothetical protein HYH03_007322 [Edaphochlamys debaryana]|uniref:Uncharacterized protein n=1 Tax=Edaphochlamys debaryana TaxID=47281 RepID=A0A835Y8W5_9CHLO|nr:hypothetical protein HYH03_007322 [Edaphochlamys debaryana]|eukprot:KAG2494555.1 hypothetical protein HYH03_007322 [Edaphochlamys debaryana]
MGTNLTANPLYQAALLAAAALGNMALAAPGVLTWYSTRWDAVVRPLLGTVLCSSQPLPPDAADAAVMLLHNLVVPPYKTLMQGPLWTRVSDTLEEQQSTFDLEEDQFLDRDAVTRAVTQYQGMVQLVGLFKSSSASSSSDPFSGDGWTTTTSWGSRRRSLSALVAGLMPVPRNRVADLAVAFDTVLRPLRALSRAAGKWQRRRLGSTADPDAPDPDQDGDGDADLASQLSDLLSSLTGAPSASDDDSDDDYGFTLVTDDAWTTDAWTDPASISAVLDVARSALNAALGNVSQYAYNGGALPAAPGPALAAFNASPMAMTPGEEASFRAMLASLDQLQAAVLAFAAAYSSWPDPPPAGWAPAPLAPPGPVLPFPVPASVLAPPSQAAAAAANQCATNPAADVTGYGAMFTAPTASSPYRDPLLALLPSAGRALRALPTVAGWWAGVWDNYLRPVMVAGNCQPVSSAAVSDAQADAFLAALRLHGWPVLQRLARTNAGAVGVGLVLKHHALTQLSVPHALNAYLTRDNLRAAVQLAAAHSQSAALFSSDLTGSPAKQTAIAILHAVLRGGEDFLLEAISPPFLRQDIALDTLVALQAAALVPLLQAVPSPAPARPSTAASLQGAPLPPSPSPPPSPRAATSPLDQYTLSLRQMDAQQAADFQTFAESVGDLVVQGSYALALAGFPASDPLPGALPRDSGRDGLHLFATDGALHLSSRPPRPPSPPPLPPRRPARPPRSPSKSPPPPWYNDFPWTTDDTSSSAPSPSWTPPPKSGPSVDAVAGIILAVLVGLCLVWGLASWQRERITRLLRGGSKGPVPAVGGAMGGGAAGVGMGAAGDVEVGAGGKGGVVKGWREEEDVERARLVADSASSGSVETEAGKEGVSDVEVAAGEKRERVEDDEASERAPLVAVSLER